MSAQKTLTPSFKAFQALARSLMVVMPGASDMALELQHLLARASQQDEGTFLVQIQDFLGRLKAPLETIDVACNPGVFEHLEKLLSTFADFIQGAEPKLAVDIKAALAKKGADKKEALLKQLEEQKFAAALAHQLKAFLTPSHLNKQEHFDSVQDWAFESLSTDNDHVAAQGAYGENAWVRQLLRLLFTLVKMVSEPPLRSSVEKGEHHEKERRIPMKMG